MDKHRRKFIKQSTLVGSGIIAGGSMLSLLSCGEGQDKIEEVDFEYQPFGIQLWSVRDDMAKDPKGTLKKLASYGYQQIESFDGPDGIFWGMEPRDFSAYIEDLGMKLIATHANIFEDFETKAKQASEAGILHFICPYIGQKDTIDEYIEMAALFNEYGGVCFDLGMYFGYHNHDYSFKPIDGRYPQDILMEYSTDDVVFEMDYYWVHTAQQRPMHWLQKYLYKWHLVHIKDRLDLPFTETDASTLLGEGVIDYDPLFERRDPLGVNYLIVEQERFDGVTPMEAARLNAHYMKHKLRVDKAEM